ncbi:hypothetical protein H4Q26_015706 [Puccinia striiformis f. sp. tritici PST-130]|nr:hypothetical protein H4Q26_015706 [Puccinia striiformis f. sp. tritici PST-130]
MACSDPSSMCFLIPLVHTSSRLNILSIASKSYQEIFDLNHQLCIFHLAHVFVVSLIHHAQGEDKPKPFPISGCDDEAKSTVLCVRAVFPDDKLTTREGAMVAPAPKITGHARRTCNGFEITAHTADRAYCCPKEFADPFTKPSPAFEFILKEKCKPVRMDWPKEKPIQ